ncbi:hypothetical protein F7D01_09180 [Erythrobacter sp. 3-20A1M]|uniref:hypothetical protein n=1 Tax=Erythrobacter sp. 3-20A1M TaxID=2653850 RepID=UPI001BFC200E|nr:hypothetical protein [Erythrobacter sp. 3-20A1M]QWC57238.1 hypothetical protein F7D01_09180 [Erythrobacter sp. 3-20A1M]
MPVDPFSAHEALDRASLLSDMWDRSITEHSFVNDNPTLKAEAERIGEAIGAFYQMVGQQQPLD